jgi:hypothetical protein
VCTCTRPPGTIAGRLFAAACRTRRRDAQSDGVSGRRTATAGGGPRAAYGVRLALRRSCGARSSAAGLVARRSCIGCPARHRPRYRLRHRLPRALRLAGGRGPRAQRPQRLAPSPQIRLHARSDPRTVRSVDGAPRARLCRRRSTTRGRLSTASPREASERTRTTPPPPYAA